MEKLGLKQAVTYFCYTIQIQVEKIIKQAGAELCQAQAS